MRIRLLTRQQVASLLTFSDYVDLVEHAFRFHAEGRSLPPQLMHVDAAGGEFHVKGGGLLMDRWYFALKANGSFFQNPSKLGLPAIQGAILLFDAENGTPLALMDSAEITIQRTGAATAVAARHLARPESKVATICGCGKQGRVQLTALQHVLPLERAYLWDADRAAAERLAAEAELVIDVVVADDLKTAVSQSDIVVTCTPSRAPFIRRAWIRPGTFVAAIGADSPGKHELDADLLACSTVVVDLLNQAAHVGELQHPIAKHLMTTADVQAELGEILVGHRVGRTRHDEVIVYDATGTALQDVVAAAAAYERAADQNVGQIVEL